MSIEKSIQDIVQKLDNLSTRLGTIESKLGNAPSTTSAPTQSSSGSGSGGDRLTEYRETVVNPHIPNLQTSVSNIGGLTQQAFEIFQTIMDRHEKVLIVASRSKKIPINDDFVTNILTQIYQPMQGLSELANESRPTDHFLFVSSLAEGAGSMLWAQDPKPGSYIKEMIGASQFHSNKILREFKGKDENKINFVNALNGFLTALQKYAMVNGLPWNPNGGDAIQIGKEVFGSSSKPTTTTTTSTSTTSTTTASTSSGPVNPGLFSELNQGEGITGRLKKVDASQKSKNRTDRSGLVTAKKAPVVAKKQETKPQLVELSGQNWMLDYVTDKLEVEITDSKQIIQMFKCYDAVITIKGKFNGMLINSCRKVTIVFEEAISSCQLVNCQNISIQVQKSVPSIAIDKCSGCHVYLNQDSIETQVITSKSDECNISLYEKEDWKEFPIPEQFVSTIVNGKLNTVELAHIGE